MNVNRLVIFVCVLCLSACDLSQHLLSNLATDKKAHNAVIQMAIAQAPLNLDPRYASDAASERVNHLLYQSLVDFDEASKPIPSLATWQPLSPTKIMFTLVPNRAPFHHGATLTAADVKATYDSFKTLNNSPHAAEFTAIKQIEVLDDERLIVHLKVADTHFAAKMIIGILPKAFIDQQHDFSRQPVGSGPLKFIEWKQDLKLERVTDAQTITFVEVKDPTVRVLKLLRGEVDVLQGDLPPELVKYLQSQQHIQVLTGKGANFSYLGLNHQDKQLKKLAVRQAIAHAIDTQSMINAMMVEGTRVAGAILPPEHYAGNATLAYHRYQPAYARQLLQKAGIQLPLQLTYKTSTDAQRVRIATIMQAQMREAGIELTINSLDWGTFFEDVKQGNFQLYGLTWVGIKTPEIYQTVFHSQAVPPQGFNRGRFQDESIDRMLEKQDWQSATTATHKALPYIPLWYEGQFVAAQKAIKITTPAADGNWDLLATIKRVD